ncbi:MAG: serine/threonine protein kinase [Deltaproteobacteria bacterium]|nr:serine/threonine protein kinase [Deltaproteobacteria bacterium]
MRGRASYDLMGLIELASLTDPAARRASWRQSLASVARAASEPGPGLLDGIRPDALQRSVRVALESGLADNLDWLSPPAAALALYELAAALPPGDLRREVGRKALLRLHGGTAATFAAVATRMALASKKALSGHALRSRIGLCLELPSGGAVAVEPLALALASRREHAREWIASPSSGSLPARRTAARLLERAAMGAVRRAVEGDEHPARQMRGEAVRRSWDRLLADREPLVWRHVAVARGLLGSIDESLADEVRAGASPAHTPTEWRRAAVSIAASIAVAPGPGLRAAAELLRSSLCIRDPGIPATMLWALPRIIDCEPEAAEQLVELVAAKASFDAAENVAGLMSEISATPAGQKAAEKLRQSPAPTRHSVAPALEGDSDRAQREEVFRELASPSSVLRGRIALAVAAFVDEGAARAHKLARAALAEAQGKLVKLRDLAVVSDDAPDPRGTRTVSYSLIRDIDAGLLEQATLRDLLLLGRPPGGEDAPVAELEMVYQDFAQWLSAREQAPIVRGIEVPERTLRQLRLRALLHLVDAEATRGEDDSSRGAHVRDRWLRAARIFLDRLTDDPSSSIRRMLCAGLARALDGLCRSGMCEAADVTLVAALRLGAREIETLAEASMQPELETALGAWATFQRKVEHDGVLDEDVVGTWIDGLVHLGRTLADDAQGRTEVLRAVLARAGRSLDAIAEASALTMLADPQTQELTALVQLDREIAALSQLLAGARQRLAGLTPEVVSAETATIEPVLLAVERALRGGGGGDLTEALVDVRLALEARLPRAVAQVVSETLARLELLRVSGSILPAAPSLPPAVALPDWMPARRTLGAFYVMRPLGTGGVGSVFLARRAEDRHEPNAEQFALKVPDYDSTAARSLSEDEFMARFRQEAGALLELPRHQNLAGFVTFDLAARPKPILVMEFIEGTTLERLIASGALTTDLALDFLEGVLAGLAAMHAAGLGHLDVKPANVVVRPTGVPVLVDFGLTGRNLRPGCLTGSYGAPEVWGVSPEGSSPTPMAADVYAFGCTLFEALTGRTLFAAPTEVALIGAHLSHDGAPGPVVHLAAEPKLAPLVGLLRGCLRHDARARLGIPRLQKQLGALRPTLAGLDWPVGGEMPESPPPPPDPPSKVC